MLCPNPVPRAVRYKAAQSAGMSRAMTLTSADFLAKHRIFKATKAGRRWMASVMARLRNQWSC